MIPIRYDNNNNLKEYYLIENYHTTNHYGGANPFNTLLRFNHIFPHGVIIFHIRNEDPDLPTMSNLDIECADGMWNWQLIQGANTPYDRSDDLIDRITIARSYPGLDEKDWIPDLINPALEDYRALTPSSCGSSCPPNHGRRYYSDDWLGDTDDFFRVGSNDLFTKYSNPATYIYQGAALDIGIQVISYNATLHEYALSVQFGSANVIGMKPSKPQNLKATINAQHNTVLMWEGNIEPDILSGGYYKIYKAKTSGGVPSSYNLVASTSGPQTTWTDPEITVGDNTYKVFYKISATDNTNKESVLSEYSWVNYISSDITASTTFSGNLVVEKTMTVASDVALTLSAGSIVRFTESSALIVNGTLIAHGTHNKVTFDFIEQNGEVSNGIKVNFGGGLTISNTIIKNAYKGIDIVTSGMPSSITSSVIQACRDGINVQYGGRACDLTISSNQINDNSNLGIYINNQEFNMTSEYTYIDGNNIKNSNYGIYMTGNVAPLVVHSNIENCAQGINVYDAQPFIKWNAIINPLEDGIYINASGKSPQIIQNSIKKDDTISSYHNFQGIWVENNTTAYIAFNDISGFYYGIYCGGGVNSYFTDYYFHSYSANNRIRYNVRGFAAGWGSYILAGWDYGFNLYAPYNSIYSNSGYDVKSYEYSTIYAQLNWWGGGEPNSSVDETSYLYTEPILSEDPWIIVSNKINAGESGDLLSKEGGSSDIIKGIILEKEGKINDAVKHYKQMISKNSFAGFALTELGKFRKKYSVTDLQSYFNTLVSSNNNHKDKVLRILAAIYLDENRYEEAIQTYTAIINQFPNSRNAIYARFEKLYAAINHAKNLTTAGQLLQEIRALGLTDDEFLMKLHFAENLYSNASGSSTLGKSTFQAVQEHVTQSIPNEYALFGNYPNPFNPSTTISYALPFESEVSITIYDLTGSIIKSFVLNSQSAGFKDLLWDGRNNYGQLVSSGVYIYTVMAVSLEGNGKSFAKSSKLMLLK